MSTRRKTLTRRYSDIIGKVLSSSSTSDSNNNSDEKKPTVEESLSALHSARKHQFNHVQTGDLVSEHAKRMFREKRLQQSPGRPASRPATPERRQEDRQLSSSAEGSNVLFGGPGSRSATPERRTFRFRRPSIGQSSIVDSSVKDQIGLETRSARSYSISPARSRESGTFVTSNNRTNKLQYRELRDEESIRRFSRSPARRREYEKAAYRALQPNQSHESVSEATSISASSRATTSQSPPRRRGYSDNNTPNRELRLPPSASFHERKDREIVALRKELKELQDHLTKALESEQVLEKRAEKKQLAADSALATVEELQRTVHVQAEQLQLYEYCLKERDAEVDNLTQALQRSQTRCFQFELDLEVHDLKFSIYDDYRRLMDRERLGGKNDDESDDDVSTTDDDFERAIRNNQENAYVGVLSKLGQLEKIFESEKAEAAKKHAALQKEYELAQKDISRLKANQNIEIHGSVVDINTKSRADESAQKSVIGSISSTSVNVPSSELTHFGSSPSTGDSSQPSQITEMLEKRIKLLESDNHKASIQITRLQQELERSRGMQNDLTVFTNENELSILRLEKDALGKKISALETEIGFTSGKIDDKTRTRRYRALEKNLNDYIAEIMSLEDRLKAKESIISSLKEKNLALKIKANKLSLCSTEPAHSARSSNMAASETIQALDMPRSRLNTKIEELKKKAQWAGHSHEGSNGGSRIAMLRKRLDELSNSNEEVPLTAGGSGLNTHQPKTISLCSTTVSSMQNI
jgi:hypothetical protein